MKSPPRLTEKNVYQLLHFDWPGNVRQLRHSVERALLIKKNNTHSELDFSFLFENFEEPIKREEKISAEEITRVLKLSKGKIQGKGGAAELLGIHPATLRSRLKSLGIPFTRRDIHSK